MLNTRAVDAGLSHLSQPDFVSIEELDDLIKGRFPEDISQEEAESLKKMMILFDIPERSAERIVQYSSNLLLGEWGEPKKVSFGSGVGRSFVEGFLSALSLTHAERLDFIAAADTPKAPAPSSVMNGRRKGADRFPNGRTRKGVVSVDVLRASFGAYPEGGNVTASEINLAEDVVEGDTGGGNVFMRIIEKLFLPCVVSVKCPAPSRKENH